MSIAAYFAVLCDVDDCQEESTFEPTASEARRTATRDGWHFRRLGGEQWFCPSHEAEWRAAAPVRDNDEPSR